MKKITLKELLDKYGDVKVMFAYYYKFSFSFIGSHDGKDINVTVGGSGDDIYKFDVEPNKEYSIKEFDVSFLSVKENGTEIEQYSSW